MSRAQHRFRHIRLTSTRRINKEVRAANRPRKAKEDARRDAKMKAVLKTAKGKDLNPAVKSWVCRQLEKQWRQVTEADLKALAN